MIKKAIPLKYNLENVDLIGIIQNVLGNVPISFGSDRVLKIDATATPTQLQQIKADFLSAIEEVSDL